MFRIFLTGLYCDIEIVHGESFLYSFIGRVSCHFILQSKLLASGISGLSGDRPHRGRRIFPTGAVTFVFFLSIHRDLRFKTTFRRSLELGSAPVHNCAVLQLCRISVLASVCDVCVLIQNGSILDDIVLSGSQHLISIRVLDSHIQLTTVRLNGQVVLSPAVCLQFLILVNHGLALFYYDAVRIDLQSCLRSLFDPGVLGRNQNIVCQRDLVILAESCVDLQLPGRSAR